jgi:hypothetical protein
MTPFRALPLVAPLLVIACSRSSPEAAPPPPDAALPPGVHPAHFLPRDDAGNLLPRHAGPPIDPKDLAPVGKRPPDWDLDATDPARDYVERYIQSTSRYGAETACVHAQASSRSGDDEATVEARDTTSDAGCHGSDAVRDRFVVSVAQDRLRLADGSRGAPLAPWPDKSDPTAAAAPSPVEADMGSWRSPIREALVAMNLVPLRLQWFGRGSYPVVSIAGWRPPMALDGGASTLLDDARKLCAASNGQPLAIFGGMDRQHLLRIRCPAVARWDTL